MATRSDREVARRKIADDGGVHVNFILTADVDALGRICVTTRGSSAPHALTRLPGVAGTQLTAALMDCLHIRGGTWTSLATLQNLHYLCGRFLLWFAEDAELTDLTDAQFTPALAWEGVNTVSDLGNPRRQFRTFLADALAALRPDGETHQSVLLGRALPVDVHDVEGYAPEVADAIEKVAKAHVGAWFSRHRDAVRAVLGDDLPRNWLRLPAQSLLDDPTQTWCPTAFRVSVDELAAAMVLLALVDDKGPNLSVIQSLTSDSVQRAGDDASFVQSAKARNKEILNTPAPAGGLFSYGGLVEFVTAATRVERYMRDDGSEADAVEALTSAPAVMDVGVAVCANDGQSPTNPDLPCGLGPVACFLCPNGFRTPEVIPGLLAAVEFTDNIRKYEPAEWLTGEAPVLNDLARKSLAQFPPPVVAAASDEDVHNARALIACVYYEGRRLD